MLEETLALALALSFQRSHQMSIQDIEMQYFSGYDSDLNILGLTLERLLTVVAQFIYKIVSVIDCSFTELLLSSV